MARKIQVNNNIVELPVEVNTVADFVKWKGLPAATTAVALNDKIVRKDNWELQKLDEMSRLTVISAAFGG